ncbi:MAG: hypothetical protein R3308_04120 [Thiohalobacterales bacterium]|nr:hypothetical protein [Thiohalobacterales bacterium]
MTNFDELNDQNHKLTELSNVLLYLFEDRSMCDTETACSLFFNFMDRLNEHLGEIDQFYQGMLSDKEQKVNNTARLFMSGEQELKRIITQYRKKWCQKGRPALKVADHELFMQDTRELFDMVLSRIQDETEHLYPLIRELRGAA